MARIELTGNLGADADLKFAPSGDPVINFNVADTLNRRNKTTNEWEEVSTTWWRVALWGKQAENLVTHLTKGTRVVVTGDVHSREWTTDAGEKRLSFDVKARSVGVMPRVEGKKPQPTLGSGSDPWSAPAGTTEEAPF